MLSYVFINTLFTLLVFFGKEKGEGGLTGSMASQPFEAANSIRFAMIDLTFSLRRLSQYSPGQPSRPRPLSVDTN